MIQLPVITGTLERRILLNYTIDPQYLEKFLPPRFKPRLYKGVGVGGICMIRFSNLRPQYAPSFFGIDSENAAHRIAVEWESKDQKHEGVFIPKRNTASQFNYWAGGRIFPGIFQKSQFKVHEENGIYSVKICQDGKDIVSFEGRVSDVFPKDSVFANLEEASNFFAKGSVGYSLSKDQTYFQGMELRLLDWSIRPLEILSASVDLYENESIFPKGAVRLDSAMLMENLRHEWHKIPNLSSASNRME
ncbi:DUF2071 domain-containing protein [Bdellovibrio sp. HCB337]|uniref:DUF2071 domain-containing protein n=1 Tax=Bdellovibrio sp. HCB337 TaxID=3394358 RepID=UPI0039A51701